MSDDTAIEKRVTKLEKDMADHKKATEFSSTMVRKIVDVLLKQFGVKLGVIAIALMASSAVAGSITLWDPVGPPYDAAATAKIILDAQGSVATMKVDNVVCADIYATDDVAITDDVTVGGDLAVTGTISAPAYGTNGTWSAVKIVHVSTDNVKTNTFATNGTVTVMGNMTAAGTLGVTGAFTATGNTISDEVDSRQATALLLGKATATSVTLGATDAGTTVAGTLTANKDVTASGGYFRLVSTDNTRTNECGTNGLFRFVGIPTSAGASGYLWASNGVLIIQP